MGNDYKPPWLHRRFFYAPQEFMVMVEWFLENQNNKNGLVRVVRNDGSRF